MKDFMHGLLLDVSPLDVSITIQARPHHTNMWLIVGVFMQRTAAGPSVSNTII